MPQPGQDPPRPTGRSTEQTPAVAGPNEVEIEFQPLGASEQGSDKNLVSPWTVLNIGLENHWEAVFEGKGLIPVSPSGPFEITDTAVSLKHVFREGSLQDHAGPSIAAEFSALLPEVNGAHSVGASAAGIDVASMERVQDYQLGSHPESFQLERDGPRIFVNLPDQEAFAVIDRNTGRVTKWSAAGDKNSHTLAFDEASHRLFTAALQPGRLIVVDSDRSNVIAKLPCVLGVDDLWYDAARNRIYATGAGAISIFQQHGTDDYVTIATVAVGPGSGSTSLQMKSRTQDGLYVSWPNMLPQGGSEVLLYYVND